GSAATSGPSQARSSSGSSSGEAGRRRLHRGDGTPVTESAAKRQRTAEDAGLGSSRASGPRGTSGVAAPPPSPPRDTSPPGSHSSSSSSSKSSRQASVDAGDPALQG